MISLPDIVCIVQFVQYINCLLYTSLTLEENMELARKFVQEQFVTKGMIADLAFHSPEKDRKRVV